MRKKQFLSALTVLCLLLTLFPSTALAATPEDGEEKGTVGAVTMKEETTDTLEKLAEESESVAEPGVELPQVLNSSVEEAEPHFVLNEEPNMDTPVILMAEDVSGTCGTNLTWTVSGTTLTISGKGVMNNYNSGGAPWYGYRNTIARLTIEDGVTNIGDYAFYGLSNLGRVSIGSGVTSIGIYSFYGCTSLGRMELPENLAAIGERAFLNTNLGSITIPDSVVTMGDYAFSDCDSLGSVMIGKGLTAISTGAFYDCDSLATVVIGDGVKSIGQEAFIGCGSLANVAFGKGVTTIGWYAFGYGGGIGGCTKLTSITIPDNVTSIGNSAFERSGLVTVAIGSGVTSIGEGAFYSCNSLKEVIFGSSLTNIGDHAFRNCTALASIQLPENVTSIGEYAFAGCTVLADVTMGDSLTKISSYAFSGCSILETVYLNEYISMIDTYAFQNCPLIADVYYEGTEDDWSYVSVKTGNENLTKAAFHYGSSKPEPEKKLSADRFDNRSAGKAVIEFSSPASGDFTVTCSSPCAIIYNNGTSCQRISAVLVSKNTYAFTLPSDYKSNVKITVAVLCDLSANGEIDSSDALKALQCAVDMLDYDEKDILIADMDNDGELTSSDALQILRVCVELRTVTW